MPATGRGRPPVAGWPVAGRINSRSAGLSCGISSGRLRNQSQKNSAPDQAEAGRCSVMVVAQPSWTEYSVISHTTNTGPRRRRPGCTSRSTPARSPAAGRASSRPRRGTIREIRRPETRRRRNAGRAERPEPARRRPEEMRSAPRPISVSDQPTTSSVSRVREPDAVADESAGHLKNAVGH